MRWKPATNRLVRSERHNMHTTILRSVSSLSRARMHTIPPLVDSLPVNQSFKERQTNAYYAHRPRPSAERGEGGGVFRERTQQRGWRYRGGRDCNGNACGRDENLRIGGRRKSGDPETRRGRSRKEWQRASTIILNGKKALLLVCWRIPLGAGDGKDGTRERDAPRCLPKRHSGRHGVRGLPCAARARAPGGTSSLWDAMYVLHAGYVVEALARGAALAPLRCPEANCEAWHMRRGTHWTQRSKRMRVSAVGQTRGGV